jgi:hypothetical protein
MKSTQGGYDGAINQFSLDQVTISSGELHIQLSDHPDTGYIMVLLSNKIVPEWQGAIMVAIDIGEIEYFVVGDPSTDSWTTDISGTHHLIYGDRITIIFPEFPLDVYTTVAVLTILSGNYDWIPNYYENSEDFRPFEQFTDGLSTVPGGGSGRGEGSIPTSSDTSTSDTSSTSTSTSSATSKSSTTSTTSTRSTSETSTPSTTTKFTTEDSNTKSSDDDTRTTSSIPSINVDFSFVFAIVGLASIAIISHTSKRFRNK